MHNHSRVVVWQHAAYRQGYYQRNARIADGVARLVLAHLLGRRRFVGRAAKKAGVVLLLGGLVNE